MRSLIIGAALAWAATAQNPDARPTASPASAADYVMSAGQSDAFEIQSGQLAASKASRPDVRAFGQRMVKDHTQSTQMVLAAAAKSGLPASPPPALRPDQQDKLAQLSAADGAAFDTLFAAQQVQAHQEALDLQSAYARNGDDENLKKAAAKIVPVVTMHLDMLRKGGAHDAGGMNH